ncbi:MAG: type I methionyl aminopeptidase [Candidatus Omnitrophota bacterium]|nr:MAG: type I methionyl aminopeptidase [Candidatus Omnitrophota bacterium]
MSSPLTHGQLLVMQKAGKVAAAILKKLKKFIRAGISTKDVENFFDDALSQYPGMEAAFKGFMGYPSSVCVSLNEEIIHGIPSLKKIIRRGDLVSVDLGIKYQGLFVDTAYTYIIGGAPSFAKRLVRTTYRALYEGIKRAQVGSTVGNIGAAIQGYIEKKNCSVIRKFVGHGIGEKLHLPPEIPNYGKKGEGMKLTEGNVLAIEPMVSAGGHEVEIDDDGWTARTKDNSLSAHFEHTVAITKKGPWILTQ